MNTARWFALVVILQAALLLGWAGYHEWNRGTAPTILLETAPVDPRDVLRGDYMILSYKISRVPAPASNDGAERLMSPGRDIWVTLRQNGRLHEVVSTSWAQPVATEPGQSVVHGRTQDGESRGGQLVIDYGIEKFFVPEGQGHPHFKEMVVEATVSPSHELGIKRLLLDGKAYP